MHNFPASAIRMLVMVMTFAECMSIAVMPDTSRPGFDFVNMVARMTVAMMPVKGDPVAFMVHMLPGKEREDTDPGKLENQKGGCHPGPHMCCKIDNFTLNCQPN